MSNMRLRSYFRTWKGLEKNNSNNNEDVTFRKNIIMISPNQEVKKKDIANNLGLRLFSSLFTCTS